jgi:hypothetical protein
VGSTVTRYPCLTVHAIDPLVAGGGPCAMTASYFAQDNRASLGQLCRQCWIKLSLAERDLYGGQELPRAIM